MWSENSKLRNCKYFFKYGCKFICVQHYKSKHTSIYGLYCVGCKIYSRFWRKNWRKNWLLKLEIVLTTIKYKQHLTSWLDYSEYLINPFCYFIKIINFHSILHILPVYTTVLSYNVY